MIETTKLQKLKKLTKYLNDQRELYYTNNTSEISDIEYDRLFDELEQLENELDIILNNSPTQTVGYKTLDSLEKFTHTNKLLSLKKTKSVDELEKFRNGKNVLVSFKGDGLTNEITYENGKLIRAVTRGNGEIGEVITHNALTYVNLPKTIPYKGRLRVVGEALIDWKDFYEINNKREELGLELYKNPRNLVSGSVRQLDSSLCAKRSVKFRVFGVNEGFDELNSKHEKFVELEKLGFEIINYYLITSDDNDLKYLVDDIAIKRGCDLIDYAIDGIVMTYDDINYSKSLGNTEHHYRDGIAYKYEDDLYDTVLRDIEIDVGKNGQVSFTGIFDPVDIDGSTITRATLNNIDYIKTLELGIGDRIAIIKANEVIPAIVENYDRSNSYKFDYKCPYCNTELSKKLNSDGSETVHLYCNYIKCDRIIERKLEHFVSKNTMDIRGMSSETIKAIRNIIFEDGSNVLDNISDIYDIAKNRDILYQLDRFGEKKIDNLIKSINDSKTRPLSNVLYSLGIDKVGRKASKLIAEHFIDMDNLLYPSDEDLDKTICGLVGDAVGSSFIKNFYSQENTYLIERLQYYGLTMTQEIDEPKGDRLNGMTFVVTGKVFKFKNRKELESKIVSLGGKIGSGVNSKTTYLINNDKESGSSKNKKAIKLEVKIISEDEFIEMIK